MKKQKHKLSQFAQHEVRNLNSPVTIKKIGFIILRLLPKSLSLDGFIIKFYQMFKELTPVLYNLPPKTEGETLPN